VSEPSPFEGPLAAHNAVYERVALGLSSASGVAHEASSGLVAVPARVWGPTALNAAPERYAASQAAGAHACVIPVLVGPLGFRSIADDWAVLVALEMGLQ